MEPDDIVELGNKAKKRVSEEYTWDKICGKYEIIFWMKRHAYGNIR